MIASSSAADTRGWRGRSGRLSAAGIAVAVVAAAAATALSVLAQTGGDAAGRAPFSLRLRVVDEAGHPIARAVFSAEGRDRRTDRTGRLGVSASHPRAA